MKLKQFLKFLCIFILFYFHTTFATNTSQESEKIISFQAKIIVNPDGSINVTEIIKLFANQDKITYGLLRRLPTRYVDTKGISHIFTYQIQSILLNDLPVPYQTHASHHQVRIKIGNKKAMLKTGIYTYTIQYRANFAVQFLKNTDEFVWFVTGYNWKLPILIASAEVTLPQGTKILRYLGYVATREVKQVTPVKVTNLADNQILFETTSRLHPGNALILGLAWEKGVIVEPNWWNKLTQHYQLNRSQYFVFEITLLTLIYYFLTWFSLSREPRKTAIKPDTNPPLNLSAAAMRYILQMEFDVKTLTVAIVSLASKGFIAIKNWGDSFTLIQQSDDTTLLDEHEKKLARCLFKHSQEIDLTLSQLDKINLAEKKLYDSLRDTFQNLYFKNHKVYLIPGYLLTLFAFLAIIFFSDDVSGAFFSIITLSFWTYSCFILLNKTFGSLKKLHNHVSYSIVISFICTLVLTIIFLIGEVILIKFLTHLIPLYTMPILFFLVVLDIIFYHLLQATPTIEGRKVMDEIEGFKLFLQSEQYAKQNEKTLELFEKDFPFAVAFDIEDEFGKQYDHCLKLRGIDIKSYYPPWYVGPTWTDTSFETFPSYLTDALQSSLNATPVIFLREESKT